jgi:hypothetical protein
VRTKVGKGDAEGVTDLVGKAFLPVTSSLDLRSQLSNGREAHTDRGWRGRLNAAAQALLQLSGSLLKTTILVCETRVAQRGGQVALFRRLVACAEISTKLSALLLCARLRASQGFDGLRELPFQNLLPTLRLTSRLRQHFAGGDKLSLNIRVGRHATTATIEMLPERSTRPGMINPLFASGQRPARIGELGLQVTMSRDSLSKLGI